MTVLLEYIMNMLDLLTGQLGVWSEVEHWKAMLLPRVCVTNAHSFCQTVRILLKYFLTFSATISRMYDLIFHLI